MGWQRMLAAGRLLGLLAAAGAALPPAAHAGPRVDYRHFFTTPVPGASTGNDAMLLYKHPGDPKAKPIPVRREVFTFPPGTGFDGSVVPDCRATDLELELEGRAACPPDTWVGGGLNDTIMTGFPGAGETPIEVDAFEAGPTRVKLIAGSQQPPIRMATEAVRKGNVVTVQIPHSPGGPPDGESAVRRVNNYFPPRSLGARAWIRTPSTCPASGVWTFKGQFIFADGALENDVSRMACQRDRTPPVISIAAPRRECVSHAFDVAVSVADASRLERVRLRLDGEVIRETRATSFTQRVLAQTLPPGRHVLSVTARDASGNVARRAAHFMRCSGSLQGSPGDDA